MINYLLAMFEVPDGEEGLIEDVREIVYQVCELPDDECNNRVISTALSDKQIA